MISQKKAGVLLSYLAQTVHILSNLIYVPIMLRILGQSEYGLFQLATATISNLSILTLGFNSAYIRFYSRYKEAKDYDGIAKLNGMFIGIFSIFAMVCIVCGLFIVSNARLILGNELSDADLKTEKSLMLILVFSMAVTFINSVFQSQINAYEKFIWLKGMDLIGYILNPCISLPLLLLGYGSTGLVIATFVISVATCIFNFVYSRIKLKISYSFKKFDWHLFKEMSGFTFFVFLNIIVEQINWSVDKYLLGRMKGVNSVAIYSVGAQIIAMYKSLTNSIRAVFIPQINKIVAENAKLDIVNALFIKLGRYIFLVTFLIYSGFLIFGKEFVGLWAGEGYGNSYLCAIIPMTALIVPIVQGPGVDIQRAMDKHKARSIAYACIAVSNIMISIYLINRSGEVGAALGTAIALMLGQGIFMNYYYHKKIGLNMWDFWKAFLRFTPGIIVLIIIGYVIKFIVYHNTVITLAIGIVLYASVYAIVMYFVCMNRIEKNIVKSMIGKVWRIRK